MNASVVQDLMATSTITTITRAFKVCALLIKIITYYHQLIDHSVLYQQKSLEEKGAVFLDPNTFSEDGTTALSQTAWTEDGQIMAYGISEKGSDLVTVKVNYYDPSGLLYYCLLKFMKANGEEIRDQIPGLKFSGLAWLHDNSGLFYSVWVSGFIVE